MCTTPESPFAGSDPGGGLWTTTRGDGLRRLTHALLAVYLLPAFLIVLTVGGILAALVAVLDLVSGSAGTAPVEGTATRALRGRGHRPGAPGPRPRLFSVGERSGGTGFGRRT